MYRKSRVKRIILVVVMAVFFLNACASGSQGSDQSGDHVTAIQSDAESDVRPEASESGGSAQLAEAAAGGSAQLAEAAAGGSTQLAEAAASGGSAKSAEMAESGGSAKSADAAGQSGVKESGEQVMEGMKW